jgi:hypothetical protein
MLANSIGDPADKLQQDGGQRGGRRRSLIDLRNLLHDVQHVGPVLARDLCNLQLLAR